MLLKAEDSAVAMPDTTILHAQEEATRQSDGSRRSSSVSWNLAKQFLTSRSDVHTLPYRNRQCPPCLDAVCRAGRSSVDDRDRRCSHSGFRHQSPDYL